MVTIWLFDKSGFTSVVGYKPAKDMLKTEHKQIAEASDDPDGWLLVRARIKADLEAVQEALGIDIHILKDGGADYAYRALISRPEWKRYLAMQVDAIDYDSHFKEVTRDNAPHHPQRYNAMMEVWSAMARLQDTKPYGNLVSTYSGGKSYGSNWSSKSYKPYDPKLVEKELTAEGEWGSITVEDMAAALHKAGNDPEAVEEWFVENATDEAFELWCTALDLTAETEKVNPEEALLTDEQIDKLASEIDPNYDPDSPSLTGGTAAVWDEALEEWVVYDPEVTPVADGWDTGWAQPDRGDDEFPGTATHTGFEHPPTECGICEKVQQWLDEKTPYTTVETTVDSDESHDTPDEVTQGS